MSSPERRNPASTRALTAFEVREMRVGTPLLVCTLADRTVGRGRLERYVDRIEPVRFMGTMPRPESNLDRGTGSWVIFDRKLRLYAGAHKVIERTWPRANWCAYEAAGLGLTIPTKRAFGDLPLDWNDCGCVIRPEHEDEFRSAYPRRVRPS